MAIDFRELGIELLRDREKVSDDQARLFFISLAGGNISQTVDVAAPKKKNGGTRQGVAAVIEKFSGLARVHLKRVLGDPSTPPPSNLIEAADRIEALGLRQPVLPKEKELRPQVLARAVSRYPEFEMRGDQPCLRGK